MKVKMQVLIILVSVLFLAGTTFVMQANFKDKNIKEKELLSGLDKESNSVAINYPESIKKINKIYSSDDIKFQDLKCVSKETYKKIAEIFSNIDFMGDFKPINLKEDSYREKYLRVLKGEESYINKQDNELVEFGPQNMKKHTYYYFDMYGDGVPKLIVFGNDMRYTYIFSFNTKINKVELFDIEKPGTSYFLGDNKIGAWFDGTGLTYHFYELDENGDKNFKMFFRSEGYLNDITKEEDVVYMVGFVEGSEGLENYKLLAKEMGEQLYEKNSVYYLRILKEQYDQVTQNYFKSRKLALENIKKVTYAFDELFG